MKEALIAEHRDIATGTRHDERVYAALVGVVEAIGGDAFYDRLSSFVADETGCEQRLVMRYSAFDKPQFLVNYALDAEAVDIYLAGLYRIDPLQDLSRSSREPKVVNLRGLESELEPDENYLTELFKIAIIFDELAFLLPAPGGVTIAVCCERRDLPFNEGDRTKANLLLPLAAALHRQHLDSVFARLRQRRGPSGGGAIAGAVLALDSEFRPVHASLALDDLALSEAQIDQVLQAMRSGRQEPLPLTGGLVAHWEPAGESFSIAPGGVLLFIERRSEGPLTIGAGQAIQDFCNLHQLTKRESDIVRLIMLGWPNSKIAKQLNVSVGTVKNHRWRLYNKLDITTEREMFFAFISMIVASDGTK